MYKRQTKPGLRQEYYDVEGAAAFLNIGTTTMYKAIQQRQIKHARIGKSIRISHANLTQWVEDQTKPTLAELKAKGYGHQVKHRQPIRNEKRGRLGRPPLWPPQTIEDYRKLAQRIEKKMLKEESKDILLGH